MNRSLATSFCLLLVGSALAGCSKSDANGTFAPIYPGAPATPSPTTVPTTTPSGVPTSTPTMTPSGVPTSTPTMTPSGVPTTTPTMTPSGTPTTTPTMTPSGTPTTTPTMTPSGTPTLTPTMTPTMTPSGVPTLTPTMTPTLTPTMTPTVTPTMMPTAGPAGVLTVNPNPVQLYGTGTANAMNAIVGETGYTGTFAETDTCSGVAVVSTTNDGGPSATYAIVGQGSGTCTATFKDSTNQSVALTIKVTTNGFVISGHARHR